MMVFLIIVFLTFGCGFTFYDNFKEPRMNEFDYFCEIELTQDHRGWSVRQPPEEWTNVTITIDSQILQMTTAVDNQTVSFKKAYCIDYSNNLSNLTINVNYWGQKSVTLYWAFFYPKKIHCDATVNYGNRLIIRK